jgi:hypothetical protein
MPVRHVIVDGSNLATEGRSLPSLAQLDQAVREFLAENPDAQVTVVVDASFGHRIDPSELPMFEEAEAAGEVVSPPAGAIGRGDAFLLRIAEKTGATVLSNDSFQEFHGEHSWLFDDGRLIGGKPVPGVGWIFMPRAPVRGQKSREVVKEAKRKKRVEEAAGVAGVVGGAGSAALTAATGLDLATRAKGRGKKVDRAIARATEEAVAPKTNGRRRRRGATPPAEPVNEPLAFITFIAAHPLGSEVIGTVTEFSSHGAFVDADGVRCYLPLSAMGDPPPRRAREMVSKGEERSFVVQALDPQRRGVELALPGFARVAGGPTEETVEAEIHEKPAAPKRRRREKTEALPAPVAAVVDGKPVPELEVGTKKAPAVKKASKSKEPTARKSTRAKKATQVDEAPVAVPTAQPVVAEKPAAKRATGAAAKAGAAAVKTAAEAIAGAPATKAEAGVTKARAGTTKAGAAPTKATAAATGAVATRAPAAAAGAPAAAAGAPASAAATKATSTATKAPATAPKTATRSAKKSAAASSPPAAAASGTGAETEPESGPPAKKATRSRTTGTAAKATGTAAKATGTATRTASTAAKATGTATRTAVPTGTPADAEPSAPTRRRAAGSAAATALPDEQAEPGTRAAKKKTAAANAPARAKQSAGPPSNPN